MRMPAPIFFIPPARPARILVETFVIVFTSTFCLAQAESKGWQPITTEQDVDFAFIVYPYGDGANAGAVVKITNRNTSPASYRFRVVFRSGEREWTSDVVRGRLDALEVRTGELSGLWWIPFKDGVPITEVGLKGLRIRIEEEQAEQSNGGESS